MTSGSAIQPIRGGWFEVQHHAEAEGKYWNPAALAFTAAQWREKVREMAEIGMDHLVLTSVALAGRAFYPTALIPSHDMGCDDPVEAILAAADEVSTTVFVGNDFFGPPMAQGKGLLDPEQIRLRLAATEELVSRYGHHPSFQGWYYPHECGLHPYFDDAYMQYAQINSREIRRLTPNAKILIAPYGTKHIRADATFIRQLESLDVDIVAYQDEVGVEKSREDETEVYFEQLRLAHDQAGRAALWADVEIFRFEGQVYKSALLPASFERVERQLRAVSPYVDLVLVYQYQGLMNKPGSQAHLGAPGSETLYADYVKWLGSQRG